MFAEHPGQAGLDWGSGQEKQQFNPDGFGAEVGATS